MTMKSWILSLALLTPVSSAVYAQTSGPVTDPIGVVKLAPGEPIVLGQWGSMSGPDSTQGIDERRGMEVAISDAGSQISGFPIKLLSEDAQCTAEGGQLAASKLAGTSQLLVALGPSCSSGARSGAPILWKAGVPTIGIGSSAPALTDPGRPEGFAGFMRVVPNDIDQAAFAAHYAADIQKYTTAATIHDGSPFTEQLVRAFEKTFKEKGGKIVAAEAISPSDTDMRPVLTRIGTSKPQIVFMPIFVSAAAFVTRQAKEIPDLAKTELFGAGSTFSPGMIEAAGDSVVDFRVLAAAANSYGKDYPEYLKKYAAAYGEEPTGSFSALGHDAAVMAIAAIKKVAKVDGDGTMYVGRQALRDALLETKDISGLSGPIACTKLGDCGSQAYAVWKYTGGEVGSFEAGKNPVQIAP
ncbi:branched-chain amino acid ABC transporter substrate-binding protein [Labrys wisconsinensis]|uniref:Branched-chain amino acid transport system substrate-binding protein n=1 Tax=Labrys wisconsinensis TaxID=425677 RepID=A0ABU0JCU8_9HYPH|nr:branched-chain amino acid ABC transporter substrate-binding protein [Labrys wisconsinensis]MDQ0472098.1 branched-chain amino acid transport system substrate-binding protein [Labrys wisconsinensis]